MKTYFKYIISVLAIAASAVTAFAAGEEHQNPEGIVATKKVIADPNDPNKYTIEIETYVTGSTVTTKTEVAVPTDIVLALDFSSSMVTTDYATYTGLPWTYTYNNCIISAPSKDVTKPYYFKVGDNYYEIKRADNVDISSGGETQLQDIYYLYYEKNGQREYLYADGTHKRDKPTGYTTTSTTLYKGVLYNEAKTQIGNNNTIYTYESDINNLYCKEGNGGQAKYYPIKKGTEKITPGGGAGQKGYGLYFTMGGTNYYLNPNEASGYSATPYGVASADAVIYTGELYGQTRLTALQRAMFDFIDTTYKNTLEAAAQGIDHYMGLVTFEMDATIQKINNQTYYKVNNASVVSQLKEIIFTTVVDTGTNHGDACDKASTIIKAIEGDASLAGRESKHTVLLFTDGETFTGGNDTVENKKPQANTAIGNAYSLKHGGKKGNENSNHRDVTVFCVSLLNQTTLNKFYYVADFGQLVSSQYPNATGLPATNAPTGWDVTKVHPITADGNTGTPNTDGKQYYYQATDGMDLSKIFTTIADEGTTGGATYELDSSSTTVIDVMSNAFKLPDGADSNDIQLYAVPVTGYDAPLGGSVIYTWGNAIEIPSTKFPNAKAVVTDSIDNPSDEDVEGGKVVKVNGFDFSENYVGVDTIEGENVLHNGYKLRIVFPIVIDPNNPGGANVPTNDPSSGIYVNGKPIYWYEQPKVKIPNIVIVKNGLALNESAIFTVHEDVHDGSVTMQDFKVIATCTESGKPAIAMIKIQNPGRFTVTEETWSWAYEVVTPQKDYEYVDSDDTDNAAWIAVGYTTDGVGGPKIPSVRTTVVSGSSITRNVNDFTEDPEYSGTPFIFTNSHSEATKTNPAHGENYKNNEFINK